MQDIIQIDDLKFVRYIDKAIIEERINEIGKAISEKYRGKNPLLIGVLNGAFIFLGDLARACDIELETTFIKLSSYKGTESTGKIETLIGLNQSLHDRHVIIVEDIIDTGATMHDLIPKLMELNPISIEIASLLVKRAAIQFDIEIGYAGFEITNEFVVGYGLDYNQKGRNLSSIYQLYQP